MTDGNKVKDLHKFTPWFSRDDVDFVYIPTLRCGHNWAKNYLLDHGFVEVDHDAVSHKTRLMIIRNPLERILSGMYAIENFDYSLLEGSTDRLLEELSSDPHTSHMINVIPDDGHTDYVFIKFDTDTDYAFRDFLAERGLDLPEPKMEWQRETMGYSSRKTRAEVFSNNTLTATLMNYLKEDYDFYNNINWYQS